MYSLNHALWTVVEISTESLTEKMTLSQTTTICPAAQDCIHSMKMGSTVNAKYVRIGTKKSDGLSDRMAHQFLCPSAFGGE